MFNFGVESSPFELLLQAATLTAVNKAKPVNVPRRTTFFILTENILDILEHCWFTENSQGVHVVLIFTSSTPLSLLVDLLK